jgi:hypothetical protein
LGNPINFCNRKLAAVIFLFALPSAAQELDAQRNVKAELLALHSADRRDHLERNVDSLLARIAWPLFDVRKGKISRTSRDEMRSRFADYFRRAEFSAWDDVEPPVVRVSPDGKMAWMIFRVRIAYTETQPSGKRTKQDSIIAWMSAYEKQNGKWLLTAVTSTFEEK